MGDTEVRTDTNTAASTDNEDRFRISLAELVVILGVVFLLAVILIPIAKGYSSDQKRLDNIERFKPPQSDGVAPTAATK
ncbi:MAG: hypothetical protein QNJ98_02590 [Planctomycetota bacterium]|nr:hypothetical protein [Planctomycetota bacterium]